MDSSDLIHHIRPSLSHEALNHTCKHANAVLTEELPEAALAVGLLVLLLEGSLVQLLQAERAHKVLRVELLAHGCDAAAGDGLLAAGAQGAAALVVVRLAVRLAVVLEEAAVYERRETLLRITTTVWNG